MLPYGLEFLFAVLVLQHHGAHAVLQQQRPSFEMSDRGSGLWSTAYGATHVHRVLPRRTVDSFDRARHVHGILPRRTPSPSPPTGQDAAQQAFISAAPLLAAMGKGWRHPLDAATCRLRASAGRDNAQHSKTDAPSVSPYLPFAVSDSAPPKSPSRRRQPRGRVVGRFLYRKLQKNESDLRQNVAENVFDSSVNLVDSSSTSKQVAQAMMTASTDLHDALTLGGTLNPKFLHFAAVGVNVVYASAAACMNAVALTLSSAMQHLTNDKVISAVDMQTIIFSVH